MHARILFLLFCAAALSSCAGDDWSTSSKPKLKQEAHTGPMGQTIYKYREVDDPASR
jgi:hypothetical protein